VPVGIVISRETGAAAVPLVGAAAEALGAGADPAGTDGGPAGGAALLALPGPVGAAPATAAAGAVEICGGAAGVAFAAADAGDVPLPAADDVAAGGAGAVHAAASAVVSIKSFKKSLCVIGRHSTIVERVIAAHATWRDCTVDHALAARGKDTRRRVSLATAAPVAYADRMSVTTDVLARRVWSAMFDLLLRSAPKRSDSLARRGLTPNDARAIFSLDAGSGRSMRALAEEWRCDPSNATWMVDRLEQLGLARRRALSDDRRVKLVALTRKGVRTRAALLADFHRPPTEFDRLRRQELQALDRALAKLASRVRPV
jgi:DNA-binding MarR family transcriptional regulator